MPGSTSAESPQGQGGVLAAPSARPWRRAAAILGAVLVVASIATAGVLIARPGRPAAAPAPRGSGGFVISAAPGRASKSAGCSNVNLYVWNVATARRGSALSLQRCDLTIFAVALSLDGRTAAVINGFDPVLYDVATWRRIGALAVPGQGIAMAEAFSPDAATLATDNGYGRVYLQDVVSGHTVATLADSRSQGADAVAFSPDGAALAADDGNGRVDVWDVAARRLTATISTGSCGQCVTTPVAFSPDGRLLAVGDRLWDVATGQELPALSGAGGIDADAVAFSPDGSMLAADDPGAGAVDVWDVATGQLAAKHAYPGAQIVLSVAFGPGGRRLAAGMSDGSARFWNLPEAPGHQG